MKLSLLGFALAAVSLFGGAAGASAAEFVNLTPQPKQMTAAGGELALPQSFAITCTGLSDDMTAEVDKFIATFNAATGLTASRGADGLFAVEADASLPSEGYKLDVTASGVTVRASAPAGLFYAFQTVKKIMPANVALGIAAPGSYALPLVSITDEPRYVWRGFELDVARHYFTVDEIKRMLDIMAVYKMNRFHWHLTDDQGWRLEMPKYPKLTTEAAAPLNAYWWDFDNRQRFTTNRMYGPYYYTVDQMKEIVAYAKERHIEVCPEVDMPGHMQAAIAAYPEFSTTPESQHPVRYYPGVSTDVLDISNPAVVRFTKDIIDQLAEIFPYEYIHIGGDECPTTAWANSPSCQQFKADHGLKSDQAIQNWLSHELATYAREKHGRRLVCWNEVLTANGADKQMAKEADFLVYCWLNGGGADNPSRQAADLGLRSVWCATGAYYLDYPQWSGSDEPVGMGPVRNLQTVYNATPDYDEAKKELYYGVNCNLWTEYISEAKHMEYMALPRMIAVAETGWSPNSKKNFQNFLTRFNADTEMLDLGGYTYGRHYVTGGSSSEKVMPEAGKYYRLVTRADADANRRDRAIELVREGSPLISSNSAVAGKLWTNVRAAESSDDYNWQYWTFEADPAGSGKYAMVNRRAPEGSLSPDMEGSSVGARWSYDSDAKHYNFLLGEHYGTDGSSHYYSIRSDKGDSWWLNCAQAAQNLAVNNWNDPTDGNGGLWTFVLEGAEEQTPSHPAFEPLDGTMIYTFANTLFPDARLGLDNSEGLGENSLITCSGNNRGWMNEGWAFSADEYDSRTNVQKGKLYNHATGAYVGALGQSLNTTSEANAYNGFQGIDNGGNNVTVVESMDDAAEVSIYKVGDAFAIEVGGKRLFAFGPESTVKPDGVNARANAPEANGGLWTIEPADACLYTFTDADSGIFLYSGIYYGGIPSVSPLPDYEIVDIDAEATMSPEIHAFPITQRNARLRRTGWTVTYNIMTTDGVSFGTVTETAPVGKVYTPAAPAIEWLADGRLEGEHSAAVPAADLNFTAVYKFDGVLGVRSVGKEITDLDRIKENTPYLIHDNHADRHAFRAAAGTAVGGIRSAEGAAPSATWALTLESGKTNRFYVRNLGNDLYIQQLKTSQTATLGADPVAFTFKRNGDHWTIYRGTMYWDGDGALNLVGWSNPGHPYQLFEVAEAAPFFKITFDEVDTDGNLLDSRSVCVAPGADYIFEPSLRRGRELVGVEGNDKLTGIMGNRRVVVTYRLPEDGIGGIAAPAHGADGIYDLRGNRLRSVTRPGIYIINGVKTAVR